MQVHIPYHTHRQTMCADLICTDIHILHHASGTCASHFNTFNLHHTSTTLTRANIICAHNKPHHTAACMLCSYLIRATIITNHIPHTTHHTTDMSGFHLHIYMYTTHQTSTDLICADLIPVNSASFLHAFMSTTGESASTHVLLFAKLRKKHKDRNV